VSTKPLEPAAVYVVEALMFEGTAGACWTSVNDQIFWEETFAQGYCNFLRELRPQSQYRVQKYVRQEESK
jgi:hypothetical protein